MGAMKLFLLLLVFHLHLRPSFTGDINSMESVPDLGSSMYMAIDGYPCVRLLNLSGEIGCSNPGRGKVVAPIVRYESAKELVQPSALLVSVDDMQDLFTRISNNSTFARNIGGILVKSKSDVQQRLKGFSPAWKFPQAEFAPYQDGKYEWNTIGSGIMWKSYNFPVFLLSESSTPILQEVALTNEKKKETYTSNVAEFDLVMQTNKVGTHDSASCLKEESCLPLGGYSVWSSLRPINISSSDHSKPIILLTASMDSASFFRDQSPGADSPISGLIALIAAVDALSGVEGAGNLPKQLAFLVFTGESWGYLGSRRFLLELDLQSDSVHGLNGTLIETVIEIGSIGKGFSQGRSNFFAHTAGVSSVTNETLDAFKHAEESLRSENISIVSASTSNPGIPPSSLMAFLRKNSSISGVVLEDFDTNFTNKFYHSHLDDLSNINSSAIVSAASLVARALYILARGHKNVSSSTLSDINVNRTLVEELMDCLLSCEPGLSCHLVKKYISPTNTCPNHYVGVVIGKPSSAPYPGYIHDVSRFLWNFMADKTSISQGDVSTICSEECGKRDGVCIMAETDGKGVCVVSTTRYVPAYSTRLVYESGSWKVLPQNSSDPMGMLDPVWTESNWDVIGLRVYTNQSATYDHLVLLGGISITVLSYLAIVIIRALITKALKRD